MTDEFEMGNKEVIQKLKGYFLKQKHEDVAYIAASLILDLCRFSQPDKMTEAEKASLIIRTHANLQETRRFLRQNHSGELKITRLNSDE